MHKKFLFILLFIWSFALYSPAQTYLISNGGTVSTCTGDFYDSGGNAGDYQSGEDYTMTFCSNSTTNTHIRVYFWEFNINPADTLYIYDGNSTAAPLIGTYNNANTLFLYSVQASISNASGCLTFRFKSHSAASAPGWEAEIFCQPLCQTVLVSIDSLNTSPHPNDTSYIPLCFGDSIHFAAMGIYPQNNMVYTQSDATSTFEWDFGDGNTATGQVVDHYYAVPMGYDVALTITDVNGCVSTNTLDVRVMMSRNPITDVNALSDICSGSDTVYMNVGYDPNSVVTVEPIGGVQSATESFDSTMFIPDGPNCPQLCYNTDVTFTSFAPGQTVNSASDILSICVNMEHTFVGDLDFTIICPNSQQVVLKSYINSGGANLGNANSNDNSSQPCAASANPPGTGWNYCWSEIYPTIGTFNTHSSGTQMDSTNIYNNTGYYDPEAAFAGLIGCPLNGTWTIKICDNWGIDNGYIFNWTLNLDPNLVPQGWTYDVPIDSVGWYGSFLHPLNDSTAYVIPDSGGTYSYIVTVYDAFGCSWDTTLFMDVIQTPEPNLGNDTIICDGQSITLDGGDGDIYYWSTGDTQKQIQVSTPGVYIVYIENTNGSKSCYGQDTIEVSLVPDPMFDLGYDITLCSHEEYIFNAQAINSNYHYLWTFDGQSVTTPNSTWHVNEWTPGQHMIIVDLAECPLYADTIMVTAELCEVKVPNVFTPNGDGVNDEFQIEIINSDKSFGLAYPNSTMLIYNRWGKKIYENPNYNGDGSWWNGEKCAEGVYFWVLQINLGDGTFQEVNGVVHILDNEN